MRPADQERKGERRPGAIRGDLLDVRAKAALNQDGSLKEGDQ